MACLVAFSELGKWASGQSKSQYVEGDPIPEWPSAGRLPKFMELVND